MPIPWIFLTIVAACVIVVDQAAKALIVANVPLNGEWAPIPDLAHLFAITHTTNTGAAFGIFPDSGVVFLIIPVIVSGFIVYYYRKLPDQGGWPVRLALGLQLGGALGNLIDRVRLGYVVDFIHLKFWPVFNVADSCIVIGVVVLAGVLLLEDRKERRQGDAESAPEGNTPSAPGAE